MWQSIEGETVREVNGKRGGGGTVNLSRKRYNLSHSDRPTSLDVPSATC